MAKKKPKGPNPRWTADEYHQARSGRWLERIAAGLFACAAFAGVGIAGIIPQPIAWTISGVGAVVLIACIPIMISRRAKAGAAAFTPSTITDPYDRASADYGEHQRPWLRQGTHSRAWLIAAPDADPEAFTSALRRLDKGLQGVMAPLKPTWYQRVERTGYLILFVPGVIALAISLLAGANWAVTITATIFAMWMVGYPLAAGLTSLARSQGARREEAKALPVLSETDPLVRPLQPANQNAVMKALDRGGDETEIQALAFQAAGTDTEADQAAARLVDLSLGRNPAH